MDYYYETDGTKEAVKFKATSHTEAVQSAERFASLRGEKLILVYTEAQDVVFCAD